MRKANTSLINAAAIEKNAGRNNLGQNNAA